MKNSKYIVLTLLAAVSCARVAEENQPASNEEKVPVKFGLGIANVQETTKAAIDAWSGAENLYIYGFERNGQTYQMDTPFIDNVMALSPDSGTSGLIELYRTGTEPYYYEEGANYDFWGYFVADAVATDNQTQKPEVSLVADQGYKVDLTITGSQDVMVAKTDRVQASADHDVAFQRIYSSYAARRGVHPELIFQHVLSRFRFRVISGNAATAADVKVDAVTMESNTTAGLFVAGPAVDGSLLEPGTPSWLSLGLQEAQTLPAYQANATELPGSVLVMPGQDKYALKMHLTQTGVTDSPSNTVELEVDFDKMQNSADDVAVAGHQYWVTITVYGLEAVSITVSLTDWQPGGEVEVDPDKDALIYPSVVGGNSTLPAVGGTIEVHTETDDTVQEVTISHDAWIHETAAPNPAPTKGMTSASRFFTIDANDGTTRTGHILFYADGKYETSLTIVQEGSTDFPAEFGIYYSTQADYVFNPDTELISVYAVSGQRYSRFLFPATNTVYELGPIPASLSLNQEFDARFTVTQNGVEGTPENVHLRVVEVNGRRVRLLDTATWNGYTLIY